MLIIKIKGGLGNQMFQYATGLSLSIKTNKKMILDTSYYDKKTKDTPRKFELKNFNIDNEEIKYKQSFKSKILKKLFRKYYLDYHPTYLKKIEKKLHNNKDVFIDGYFQNEKNFKDIRANILDKFQLKEKFLTQEFIDIKNQIDENSVSIHIRRGDYFSNPEVRKKQDVFSKKYYEDAIKLIAEKIEEPVFFIFSDDTEWVKENIKIDSKSIFVSGRKLSAPQEMILMSKCHNNIISNSTFSWWAAWLNENNNKIVIAPKKWDEDNKNITLERWIKI